MVSGARIFQVGGTIEIDADEFAQQLDFYIRSPEANDANHPRRAVFDHFFAMEVTWK